MLGTAVPGLVAVVAGLPSASLPEIGMNAFTEILTRPQQHVLSTPYRVAVGGDVGGGRGPFDPESPHR